VVGTGCSDGSAASGLRTVDVTTGDICYEHVFVTAQGSPLTRLRRALAGGDLLAARTAAGDLPHVDLEEAAVLLVLIAREDPGQARACRRR
jgi:hypothetical protein